MFSSSYHVGGLIRTDGGLDEVYPEPTAVIAIPVMVPAALITGVPNALVDVVTTPVVLSPIEVDAKLTIAVLYPIPPVEIATELIVPKPETIAVPAAPDLTS